MELFRAGKSLERVDLWREVKREFPNNLFVLYELMYALDSLCEKKHCDEIIEYGERILAESTDNSLRGGAIQVLGFTYYFSKGDAETARKYARMLNDYSLTSNQMISQFYEGDEAVEHCQSNIQELVDKIWGNTYTMCWKGNYSPEDRIKAFKFVIDCFSLLYSDGNFGFYHGRAASCYTEMASCYLKLGDCGQMFDCLEKAAEHAVKFDMRKDGAYTAFMVNKLNMSLDNEYKNYTENNSGLLLKELTGERYSRYKDDSRMKKIVDTLKAVAVM